MHGYFRAPGSADTSYSARKCKIRRTAPHHIWVTLVLLFGLSACGQGQRDMVGVVNLTPSSGPVGTVVTINGTGFGATQRASTVTFNGIAATVMSWTATSLTTTVPAAATTGNVVVTVDRIASN